MSATMALAPAAIGARSEARWPEAAHLAVVALALALWVLGVRSTDVGRIDDFGLVPAFPATFYAACALLLAGFAAAVTSRRLPPPVVLGAYVVGLVLVIHGTAPLLYDEPRYAWTYKHLAVTDLIASTGHVDRSLDIYNNWPGFFVLAGWLQRLSGVPMIDVAGWAQVAFNLATVASLQFAFGGLTTDRRRVWLATALFLLGSWVGTDYYAPQALAFVLAFTFLGICLRATTPRRVAPRLRVALDAPAERLAAAPALASGACCWAALVVTHQLTPVLVIAAVCALVAVRRVPLWVPVAMIAVEAAWVTLAWDFLSSHFHLFDAKGVTTPDPHAGGRATPLAGVGWAALAGRVVTATLVTLAAAGVLSAVRRRQVPGSALTLILAPCLVVPLQAYGGEGVFRAYVFALPWLALLAAAFLLDGQTGARRTLRLGATLAILAAGFLPAYFGLEQANRITGDDVATSRWYEAHAGPGALAVVAAPNFPSPLTRRYVALRTMSGDGMTSLSDYPQLTRLRDGGAGAASIARFAAARRGGPLYVVLSGSQRRYAQLYGLFHPGFLSGLDRALARAPAFRRVYGTGQSSVYEYVGSRRSS
jgi:hypothetical protein